MVTRVTGCSVLEELVGIALPICQAAAECCVRPGPGRPLVIPEWVIMVLLTRIEVSKGRRRCRRPG